MTRRTLSRAFRARIFDATNGHCHICGGKIDAGQSWEVEHRIPLALGGDDEPHNMAPAHVKCHRAKTSEDAGRIAKAKRCEAVHRGFKPRSCTPMPCGRGSNFKRKMNGQVVDRATGRPVGRM